MLILGGLQFDIDVLPMSKQGLSTTVAQNLHFNVIKNNDQKIKYRVACNY